MSLMGETSAHLSVVVLQGNQRPIDATTTAAWEGNKPLPRAIADSSGDCARAKRPHAGTARGALLKNAFAEAGASPLSTRLTQRSQGQPGRAGDQQVGANNDQIVGPTPPEQLLVGGGLPQSGRKTRTVLLSIVSILLR